MAIVYKITCTVTERVYIGWTTVSLSERWTRHLRDDKGCYIQHCIKKYGPDSFVIEPLFEFLRNEDAIAKEIELIREWRLNISRYPNGNGMNMTDGGEGTIGYKATDCHRKNLSNALKGKKKSSKHTEKIRQAKLGGKNPMYKGARTEKQRESSRQQFLKSNPHKKGEESHFFGKTGYWKGKKLPAETTAKIRAAMIGKNTGPRTEETKKKIGEAVKKAFKEKGHPLQGKKMSEESRERMRTSRLRYIEQQKAMGLSYNHTKRKKVEVEQEA